MHRFPKGRILPWRTIAAPPGEANARKKILLIEEETTMAENEKARGFMGLITEGLRQVSQMIAASIFPPMVDGAETVMKKIEDGILRMEKRMLRKISSLLVIGFGAVFLVFALLFFLTESLGWSYAAGFFAIGILVFVIGLLLKIGESDR